MDNIETFESIEAIAIIGMAGRFPGAKNVEEFWQNLCNGVESISFFSDEELAAAGVDRALLNNPNYVKANAVLEDIEMFDAAFFGFTPREAQAMDPQQRLLLECAWNALENAGYDSQTYPGRIGIYAGSSMSSYLYRNLSSNPDLLKLVDFDWLQQQDPISLGNDRDYLTTRISYKLGLTGPSMSINTACSTSLVAVHTACQSLLNYQCEMALAGGVSIQVPQISGYLYREGGIASPDGHCRTFDAKAQGTLFCSGLGLVLLKRLEDALADGDYIYAVIKGSAINNDGTHKVSYTAPSVDGQVGVITETLAVAGVSPETISYIEAHGTGTALGDPIEVAAMTQAFRASTDKNGFCAIGSVKPNVGHLNRAAGIASLIKTVMALKHQLIPPSLNYEQPNPNLDFANSPFFVNTTLRQWQTNGTPRRAGVTSLGFGGTNAHAVLEEAPVIEQGSRGALEQGRKYQLLMLSAKTDSALEAATKNLAAHLKQNPELNLADVAYTLQVGRRGFNHRRMLVCRDLADAVTALETLDAKRIVTQLQESKERSVAFMFSGQGSQYVNMALELYQLEPTFREQIDLCAEILKPYLGLDLRDLLYPGEEKAQEATEQLKQTSITQPALFVIEYALAKLWMSWGIHPAATIGHSIGEYVSACLAGVFSLEDALSLVAARGKMMQQMPPGSMLAVPLSERELQPYLGNNLSLALINGPSRCVVSGTGEAIATLEKQLAAQGVEGRRLHTSHAFHSEMMEPILDAFAELVKKVTLHTPEIPYVSNVTGTWITAEQATDPNYWAKHLRQTVRFAEGLQQLFQDGDQILLEVGPGRTLSTLALQHPEKPSEQVVLTSIRHPQESQSDLAFLLNTLGKLWLAGLQVDWSGFYEHEARHRLPLPTYPFDLKRHWIEANEVAIHKSKVLSRASSKNLHPLLGQKLSIAGTEDISFEAEISLEWQAFLKHHRFFETAILPASGYLEMALAAGAGVLKSDQLLVEDLVIHQALVLPEDEVKTVQLILSPIGDKMHSFRIFSLTGDESENPEWMLHACGKVLVADSDASKVDLGALQAVCSEELAIASYYQTLQARGLNYDRLFQGIEKLTVSQGGSIGALAQIRLPEELVATASDYHLHPILLDASFQLLGIAFPDDKQFTYPLVGLDRLQVYHRPGTSLWSQVVVHPVKDSQTISADLNLFAPDGQIIAKIEGIKLKRARCEALRAALQGGRDELQEMFYEVEWRPVARFGGKHLPPDYLPSPGEISDRILPQLPQLIAQQPTLASHAEALTQLEAVSVAYVLKAFEEMKWEFKLGQRFTTAEIQRQLGILSKHQRQLNRLLEMLAEVGILRQIGDQWETIRVPEIPDAQTQMNALLSAYPAAAAELTMVERCASNMAKVLRGECDPLQLLFPEGDLTTATDLYQNSPAAAVMNGVVQKALLSALEKLPKGRGVRVLEIGGGTGGTTAHLLPHLNPDLTEYVFTDVGTLFLNRAREKFRDYPFVQYQILDIEQNPESQGFTSHQYDLIVAANVLHATTDLRETMQRVEQLLAPGGMLLLLEVTVVQRWVDLIFGITEGWWKFTDSNLRPHHALMAASQWQKLLLDIGYKEVARIPSQPESQGVLSQQTAILAQTAEVSGELTVSNPRNWLILADSQGIGQQLASKLRSQAENCIVVLAGKQYQQLSEQEFSINPADKADFQQLVKAVPPLHGVVHLWSLDAVGAESLTSADLALASQQGCGSTLSLVQSLVCGLSELPSVWLVTRGAVPAGSNLAGVAQSALWGMGKVIALEHPELKCVRVDLDPNSQGNEAQELFEEIWLKTAEDEIAWRDRIRQVSRLIHSHQTKNPPKNITFREDSTYLITGGTGGLGLLVARWMVEKGAKHLVLVSRSGSSNQIEELEQMGAEVIVAKADVTQPEEVARILQEIEQSQRPLRGVINAVGVVDNGTLRQLDWERFAKVLNPKLAGAWNLHLLTENLPLDFFVMFSSIASLFGHAGQANHSAANGFLDALAHYRQYKGLPGLSINWGHWSDVGSVAASQSAEDYMKARGMEAIAPQQGLQILAELLGQNAAQIGVVSANWSKFLEQFPPDAYPPLFSDLAKEARQQAKGQPTQLQTADLINQLQTAIPEKQRELLIAYLQIQVTKVLGLDASNPPEAHYSLNELGLDSLTSIQLRNWIRTDIKVDLPMKKFIVEARIDQLANALSEQLALARLTLAEAPSTDLENEEEEEIIRL